MTVTTKIIQKQNKVLRNVLEEMKFIRSQLEKFSLLIPSESIKEYKNSAQIKKDYRKATRAFPPK